MMKRSIIKSTGRFVPDHHITNDDLARILDTSDEWIRQRTGIEARYRVKEGGDVGTSEPGAGLYTDCHELNGADSWIDCKPRLFTEGWAFGTT